MLQSVKISQLADQLRIPQHANTLRLSVGVEGDAVEVFLANVRDIRLDDGIEVLPALESVKLSLPVLGGRRAVEERNGRRYWNQRNLENNLTVKIKTS